MPLMKKLLQTVFVTAVVSALFVVGASAESLGVGTVNVDALRMRSETSTDASILATAAKGDRAVVLEDMGNGWYKVDYQTMEGYMSAEYLDVQATVEADLGYGLVRTDGATLNVRSGPGTDYDQLLTLYNGAVVTITGMDSGWYHIKTAKGYTGYVSSDYMVPCKDAGGARADGNGLQAGSAAGEQVVEYAKQFLGRPYVWGANGPSAFDCSGFTKYVYSHFGYNLNRTASGQLNNGTAVSRNELQPGDLIFFNNGRVSTPVSHVAIYVGGGQFIHASTNTYSVQYDSLYSSYYSSTYVYARRMV